MEGPSCRILRSHPSGGFSCNLTAISPETVAARFPHSVLREGEASLLGRPPKNKSLQRHEVCVWVVKFWPDFS